MKSMILSLFSVVVVAGAGLLGLEAQADDIQVIARIYDISSLRDSTMVDFGRIETVSGKFLIATGLGPGQRDFVTPQSRTNEGKSIGLQLVNISDSCAERVKALRVIKVFYPYAYVELKTIPSPGFTKFGITANPTQAFYQMYDVVTCRTFIGQ